MHKQDLETKRPSVWLKEDFYFIIFSLYWYDYNEVSAELDVKEILFNKKGSAGGLLFMSIFWCVDKREAALLNQKESFSIKMLKLGGLPESGRKFLHVK